jgi:hypothetical protein|tara:strand:+ start:1709 stop:3691 length:1983 start_codon:yes stop_codon:yes gene_type:complete
MKKSKWYFAPNGDGEEEGFNDGHIITFKSRPHHFVAREGIQNILDAKDTNKKGEPAVALFRLFKAPTEIVIPDLGGFKGIIKENIDSNKEYPVATKFFKNALQTLSKHNIEILQLSDFSTKGITGINKKGISRWHNLIKRKGTSIAQGKRGGTFGIGKHASFACSGLRTVLYNTKNLENEAAFIWKSIFSTHGESGKEKRAAGYFCEFDDEITSAHGFMNDDVYPRPNFIDRSEYGTDLFILDFIKPRGENRQPWNVELMYTVMNNYFLSIYENELKVVFIDDIKKDRIKHELNAGNIKEKMEQAYKRQINTISNKTSHVINYPYLDAYIDSSKIFEERIEGLGLCKLYVKMDKNYPKHVARMRSPKMLVFQKRNPILGSGYAALFLCDNTTGNKKLSEMESPTHDDWDSGLSDNKVNSQKLLRRQTRFINESLKSLIASTSTNVFEIDLGDLFYEEDSEIDLEESGQNLNPGDNEEGLELDDIETAWDDIKFEKPPQRRIRKRKRKDKVADGFEPGDNEDMSGSGGKTDVPVDPNPMPNPHLPGPGPDPGGKEGANILKKIKKSQYEYRCYIESGSSNYKLVIKTNNERTCDIVFYARGLDLNKNEIITIDYANEKETGVQYSVDNNIIKKVKTTPNPKVIEVSFVDNRRYSVELELFA